MEPHTHPQPVRGQAYSLAQMERLYLRDAPFLMIKIESEYYPVQTSHVSGAELLNSEGWAETMWKYIRETHEWIPIFYAENSESVSSLVDIEKYHTFDQESYWVTPKAFPRKRYE